MVQEAYRFPFPVFINNGWGSIFGGLSLFFFLCDEDPESKKESGTKKAVQGCQVKIRSGRWASGQADMGNEARWGDCIHVKCSGKGDSGRKRNTLPPVLT